MASSVSLPSVLYVLLCPICVPRRLAGSPFCPLNHCGFFRAVRRSQASHAKETKENISFTPTGCGMLTRQWRLWWVGSSNSRTSPQDLSTAHNLFADDCALNANTEKKMQQEMDCFSRACDNFGLTISTKKTEVMY